MIQGLSMCSSVLQPNQRSCKSSKWRRHRRRSIPSRASWAQASIKTPSSSRNKRNSRIWTSNLRFKKRSTRWSRKRNENKLKQWTWDLGRRRSKRSTTSSLCSNTVRRTRRPSISVSKSRALVSSFESCFASRTGSSTRSSSVEERWESKYPSSQMRSSGRT